VSPVRYELGFYIPEASILDVIFVQATNIYLFIGSGKFTVLYDLRPVSHIYEKYMVMRTEVI
jgi:hypothetical protein